jgi:double-stranded uracil-DNA glycosylase
MRQSLAELHSAGIALWDVIGAVDRQGSLDQKIRNPRVNDLLEFIAILPQLRVVAFNGKKAAALAGNALDGLPIDFLRLPSSSAAYTLDFEQKAIAWSGLSQYLMGSKAVCNSGEQISKSEV